MMNISFNTAIGAWMFVAALLMSIIFGLIGVTGYWMSLWVLIGGLGLVLIVADNLESK